MNNNMNLGSFEQVIPNFSAVWWLAMLPALVLMTLGVAILVWPELLAFLVASFFIVSGTTMMGFAWRIRATAKRVEKLNNQVKNRARNQVRDEPEVIVNGFERRMYKAW